VPSFRPAVTGPRRGVLAAPFAVAGVGYSQLLQLLVTVVQVGPQMV
jgi:hypothetical protein